MARPRCRLEGATAPIRCGAWSQRRKKSAASLSASSIRTNFRRSGPLIIYWSFVPAMIEPVSGRERVPAWRASALESRPSLAPRNPLGEGIGAILGTARDKRRRKGSRNAMPLRAEEQKREQIAGVLSRVGERFAPERAEPIQRFVNQFYGHVPPDDVVPRGADDLYGAALSLWQFAQERATGHAKLRAFNPRLDAEGWRAGRTVIEIVNDDMPFLVDSVTAALNGLGLTVHLVIHP